MGNRIYGCDDCLAACPWNKFAQNASEMKLQARDDLIAPDIKYFLTFDDAAFRTFFSGSPVKRIGRDRFIRNVLIAAGNSTDASLVEYCKPHLRDPNDVVRGCAVWALSQLAPASELDDIKASTNADENSADVLEEWRLART
jgi:epoxyqueuosine reductase